MRKCLGNGLERAPTAGWLIVLFDTFWTLILHVEAPWRYDAAEWHNQSIG
jgi:hypothetical protein